MMFSAILFVLLSFLPHICALTFYAWMERSSFICQSENALEPVFLGDEDAIQFNCELMCGNPLKTNQACSRLPTEPNSQPSCTNIPELCMVDFIQEFNDELTFEQLLNGVQFDLTMTTVSSGSLVQEPEDESQQTESSSLQPTTIPTTTTTSTTTSTTTTTQTTSTQTTTQTSTQTTTTQTTSLTTATPISLAVENTIILTERPSTKHTFIPFRPGQLKGNNLAIPKTVPITQKSSASTTLLTTTSTPTTTITVDDSLARKLLINALHGQLVPEQSRLCFDSHNSCVFWTALNECSRNPKYMHRICKLSCGICKPSR
ncbi:hypothetical protein M3Y95_00971800 [Aphelenchoides besseyi]|nr:hypothetical protein M3Y95_00971800 [Aphelenchoides besseyi]